MNPVTHGAEDQDQELLESLNAVVPASLGAAATDPHTRTQLMDLLSCPSTPVDRSAYIWSEVAPGIKLNVVSEDSARGVKRCLVWGTPGAVSPRHGHTGDEVILVLEGQLRDERAAYGPGEICRSGAGDVHQEQVVGDTDCVCFVVYYGDLVPCS
jgi:anti-sigma factor ChrR (cupin superfamily)